MLDIEANRQARKYTRTEQLKRVLWAFAQLLFRYSFRTMFGWRNFLLRLFGAQVGKGVHIYSSATVYFPWNLVADDQVSIGEHAYIYNLGLVRLGKGATVSHRAHICAGTHDHEDPTLPLLKPAITIHDQVWVAADAFVGPGIEVGQGAIIGARGVVVKDVEPWTIVVGNPARVIGRRELRNQSG
jgi:putative colanic acid biosynthesis acetyltransferase WcaF